MTLLRRDLFDARFQLIAEGANDESSAGDDREAQPRVNEELKFVDAPSDLVPGVYEGGLKTWECSLDLVGYLDSIRDEENPSRFNGRTILEVGLNLLFKVVLDFLILFQLGCGTAVPSLYIFREVLAALKETSTTKTEFHLQDYNTLVLQLVTLPNLILTWCKTFLVLASAQVNLCV